MLALATLLGAVALAPSGAGAGATTLYPVPAPAVQPEPCPPPHHPPGPPAPPLPAPAVAEAAVPLAGPPAPRHVSLAAVSGKGIWVTPWPTAPADVAAVVRAAHAAGLRQIWIRTGSTHDGFYGGATLARLIPAAHLLGIAVIAWDFPTLSNPAADAARAARTLASGIDGFSADIEENPEGTYDTARRVADYLSLVRKAAGDRPLVATVPRPLSVSLAGFPYAAAAPYVDAFAPMIYWSCNEPGKVTAIAMQALARLSRVAPIGQDYNMGDEGGRVGLPGGTEVWRFLDVARRDGAIGASLYDLESGGTADLAALGAYPWPN